MSQWKFNLRKLFVTIKFELLLPNLNRSQHSVFSKGARRWTDRNLPLVRILMTVKQFQRPFCLTPNVDWKGAGDQLCQHLDGFLIQHWLTPSLGILAQYSHWMDRCLLENIDHLQFSLTNLDQFKQHHPTSSVGFRRMKMARQMIHWLESIDDFIVKNVSRTKWSDKNLWWSHLLNMTRRKNSHFVRKIESWKHSNTTSRTRPSFSLTLNRIGFKQI